MTTIAYKDGIMAADSRCSGDGYFVTRCQKITRLPTGALLGEAGDADSRSIVDMLSKVRNPKYLPSRADFAKTMTDYRGILVFKTGSIWEINIYRQDLDSADPYFDAQVMEIKERFYAVGSGEQFALGAMAAGASAEQAVAVACRFDTRTGPPIHSAVLKPAKKETPDEQTSSSGGRGSDGAVAPASKRHRSRRGARRR